MFATRQFHVVSAVLAVLSVFAVAATTEAATISVDLSGYFNQDTFLNDVPGDLNRHLAGFRDSGSVTRHEFFVTELGSSTITGGDGVNGDGTDIPNDGLLETSSYRFQLGTPTGEAENTILLDIDGNSSHPASIGIDVNNGSYTGLEVLSTTVGLLAGATAHGVVTLHYTDGDVNVDWDITDWCGGGVDPSMSYLVLGAGVDFYRHYPGSYEIINTSDGEWYAQTFTVDPGRVLDSVTLDVAGALNTSSDSCDVGVFAVSIVEVPECANWINLISAGMLFLLVRPRGFGLRRRKG